MTINKSNNTEIFEKFAKYYDLIYSDKLYQKECEFINSVISKEIQSCKKILDLGCGTGNHSIILSSKGYEITGVDISHKNIEIAKEKSKSHQGNLEFFQGDMSSIKISKKFDVCISMFSSLCYLTNIEKFKKTLNNIWHHLNDKGILIFDYWNGNSVITEKPSTKVKIIHTKDKRIIRIATPSLDLKNQSCAIQYHCIIEENSKIIDEFFETHTMRYYLPADLTTYLEEAGFRSVNITSINSKNNKLNNEDLLNNWYLFVIAKK